MKTFVSAKIHHIHVTQAELDYIGSVTIDQGIMDAAGIQPFEQVTICNLNNGERWTTYALPGQHGIFSLNGGGARLGRPGDRCVIMAYETTDQFHGADVVRCDTHNNIVETFRYPLTSERQDAPGAIAQP